MDNSDRPASAKILQFPRARRGNSEVIEATRRPDHVRSDPTKAIHWDAWYHQEAIVEQRPDKA